jgi:hypothetical protein
MKTTASIAAIAGTGEAVSEEYRHERERIEARHGNDDGTSIHYERQHGDRREYAEQPEAISDESPVSSLRVCGLNQRDMNQLERNDCYTIADVRLAVKNGDIVAWNMCGPIMLERVIAALKKADEVTG